MTPHRKWLQARLKEPNERIRYGANIAYLIWRNYDAIGTEREYAIKRFKWL